MNRLIPFCALLFVALLSACEGKNTRARTIEKTQVKMEDSFANHDTTWRYKYDFDGDRKPDSICYTYSGGAHCCYQITVSLTQTRRHIKLPFSIEGGYLFFDLSQPENFNITDFNNDRIHEMYFHLQPEDVKQLSQKYHFRGDDIYVMLDSGKLAVEDVWYIKSGRNE